MKRIYGDIGFGGLWNGLVLRIFMIGTLTSLRKWSFLFCIKPSLGLTVVAEWGIYDSFKVYMGFPTTGGAAPPPEK